MTNVLLSMINGLSDHLMSIIIKSSNSLTVSYLSTWPQYTHTYFMLPFSSFIFLQHFSLIKLYWKTLLLIHDLRTIAIWWLVSPGKSLMHNRLPGFQWHHRVGLRVNFFASKPSFISQNSFIYSISVLYTIFITN